ncbi:MAG TPA: PAS domain S-box protein [Desulfobacterales bacterium]
MKSETSIYNSRITRTYLHYMEQEYPGVDLDALLSYANMNRFEVEDPAHWFSQQQVDRFHERLVDLTGNTGISREVGRFAAFSAAMRANKQFSLGFVSPMLAYLALGKITARFSRATVTRTRKLGTNRIQAEYRPIPGISEKPYQCQNRIGTLEALAKTFTGQFAHVEHPHCCHRGDPSCRYLVSWENAPSLRWKQMRNYAAVLTLAAGGLLSFFAAPATTLPIFLLMMLGVGLMSYRAVYLENQELIRSLQAQKEVAEEHFLGLRDRYSNARLFQEIGRATSTLVHPEALSAALINALSRWLDFDRSVIMLADEENTHLVFVRGHGYEPEQQRLLENTRFRLRKDSQGFFVRAFLDQKPFLLEDVLAREEYLSPHSREIAEKLDVRCILCVPIVYEQESLGIIAVDNGISKRPLTQSDMNLLSGIAAQAANGLVNARSYKRLQLSEEKYRTILESIEDGYFEVDRAGNFTFFNESACRMLGYPRDELAGINYRSLVDPKTADRVYQTFHQVFETGLPSRTPDWQVIRKDGAPRFVQTVISPVRDANGRITGFRGLARDVTDRIAAEAERKLLETRLQKAEKMEAIGMLAGGVAHDLNNVLSGLVSFPELILMDLAPESPLHRPIRAIQKSGERAAAIVQDLLTLARRGVAVSKVVNLNRIVSEYLNSPEHRKITDSFENIDLQVDLDPELLNMKGSPVHLAKSLMNMIYNAVEAMPGGGRIRITTENRCLEHPMKGYERIKAGEYVILCVSDSGIGISEADIERIFEPFYTKKVMGRSGSGLGMAVVWGTVKDHQGYIDVVSRPEEGTRFTLYFPGTRQPIEAEAEISSAQLTGRGESILVVDDIAEQREIAAGMLQKLGYVVRCVSSGEAAVEHLKNHPADLLLLDMIMEPGIDGLETYRRIIEIRPGQRTVIASGYSETTRVKEAQRLGAGVYVKKPYTLAALGTAVRKELHSRLEKVAATDRPLHASPQSR